MDHYLIIARSVTYAQRMQRSLEKSGIRCQVFRAPKALTAFGCAYAIQIETADLPLALQIFHREGFDPVQIFLTQRGYAREVTL